MTRIRIGFGTAVVATAVLFFLSGSYFTAGVFIIEILLPVVLRFFLRLETNGMELEMHTRSCLPSRTDNRDRYLCEKQMAVSGSSQDPGRSFL